MSMTVSKIAEGELPNKYKALSPTLAKRLCMMYKQYDIETASSINEESQINGIQKTEHVKSVFFQELLSKIAMTQNVKTIEATNTKEALRISQARIQLISESK